jgi:hypothetical protein
VGAALAAGITVSASARARGTGVPSSIGVERMTSVVAGLAAPSDFEVESEAGDCTGGSGKTV